MVKSNTQLVNIIALAVYEIGQNRLGLFPQAMG